MLAAVITVFSALSALFCSSCLLCVCLPVLLSLFVALLYRLLAVSVFSGLGLLHCGSCLFLLPGFPQCLLLCCWSLLSCSSVLFLLLCLSAALSG